MISRMISLRLIGLALALGMPGVARQRFALLLRPAAE